MSWNLLRKLKNLLVRPSEKAEIKNQYSKIPSSPPTRFEISDSPVECYMLKGKGAPANLLFRTESEAVYYSVARGKQLEWCVIQVKYFK